LAQMLLSKLRSSFKRRLKPIFSIGLSRGRSCDSGTTTIAPMSSGVRIPSISQAQSTEPSSR
jgi:hypothetical protein